MSSLRLVAFTAAALIFLAAGFYLGDRGASTLRVTIVDAATQSLTPARVKVTDLQGRPAPLPEAAIAVMYGMWDHADGYGYQPDSSFYVHGRFKTELEPGTYVVSISKGNEYLDVVDTVRVGAATERRYALERWIDAASQGWYSADDHIHVRRSPREDPLLADWIAAEDIHVGNMLRMGDFWATYYSQYAFGEAGVYRKDGRMLVSGQEDPRTPELGHVVGLGASRFVRFRDRYYLYDLVLDSIRALGGVAGYAHQAETFHGYRGLTLDGLRDKVDLVEVVQYCAPGGPLITEHFYFLLNLGYRVTATAGSDFPWCGEPHDGSAEIPAHENARIGNARFYTYLGGDSLSYRTWMDGVRAGRTFATSGPILLSDVDAQLPGSDVEIRAGETIRVRASALGHAEQVPLDKLEIVAHGRVIASASATDEGQSPDRIRLDFELQPEHGMWIAARVTAGPMQVAHTTPVYVTVDGGGFHDRESLHELLHLSEKHLTEIETAMEHPHEHIEHQIWRHREGLTERIKEARGVIEARRGGR